MTTFVDTVTGDLKFETTDGYTVTIVNGSHDPPLVINGFTAVNIKIDSTNALTISSEGVCIGNALPESDQDGCLKLVGVSEPSGSPTSGSAFIRWDDTLKRVKTKDSAGLVSILGGEVVQSVAYTASPTANLSSGAIVQFGALTGNISIDVSNPPVGRYVSIRTIQDGTGGRTVSWAAKFTFGLLFSKQAALEASSKTHWIFYVFDSTHLECVGREEHGSSAEFSITSAGQTLRADRINVLSSSASTASLPAISTWAGRPISVKLDGIATCTISPNGAETINGQASHTITSTGAGLCGGSIYTNNGVSKVRAWPE